MAQKILRRRRGTAVVDTPKGILVVKSYDGTFIMPGGGAEKGETTKKAAIRELREETGLVAVSCKYLFDFKGNPYKDKLGIAQQNYHKAFLIEAKGRARPSNEIKALAYYKPGSKIKLGRTAKKIISKYYKMNAIEEFAQL